jgi:hypothetical protein
VSPSVSEEQHLPAPPPNPPSVGKAFFDIH